MKKLFYSLIALVSLSVGCTKNEEPETPNNVGGEPQTEQTGVTEFGATLPEGTRTTLDGNRVIWTEGDKISVWSDSEPTLKTFNFVGTVDNNPTNGNFTLASSGYGVSGNKYYAIYPASETGIANVTIPEIQKYNGEKNFSTNVNPMAAFGTDEGTVDNRSKLKFENLCGILVVQTYMTEEDRTESISSIEIEGSVALAGTGRVTFGANNKPVLGTLSGASRKITLDCSENQQPIGKSEEEANTYYVVVPAGNYSLRLTFYINGQFDAVRTVTRNAKVTVTAGEITYVGANVNVLPAPPTPPATYAVGNLYPNDEAPKGVVFEVTNPDGEGYGTSGKIIALKDYNSTTYTCEWGPDTYNSNIVLTNRISGLSNMNAIIAANALGAYPAFNACYLLRNESDIEWYLPASGEWKTAAENSVVRTTLANKGDKISYLVNSVRTGYWLSDISSVYDEDTEEDEPAASYAANYTSGSIVIQSVLFKEQGKRKVRAVARFDTTK